MSYKEEVVYKPTTASITEPKLLKADKNNEGRTNVFLYFAAFSANLMTFSCGNCFSWTSPVCPKLNGEVDPELNPLPEPLTTFQESWIVSIISLGSAVGCLVAGKLSDKIGRKKSLLTAAVPMFAAVVMLAFAPNVNLIYLGRFLAGISVGFIFSILPIYIGEIAENNNRGALGCILGVFVSFGILFSYIIGPYLSVRYFNLVLAIPILLFLVIFTLFIPESPVYLISLGQTDAALEALEKLRTTPEKETKMELAEMIKFVEESKSNSGGFGDIFRSKGLTKGLITTVSLVFFQQVAGISIVLSFLESIFASTGTSISPKLAAIAIGVVQFFMNIVTLSIVEKFGRRTLFLVSAAGTTVSIFVLGLYFYLHDNGYNVAALFWLPITSLLSYIVCFNIGLGPLPWAVLGEMFPSNVKSVAAMTTSFTCFFIGFLVMLCFPYLTPLLGTAECFWIFAIATACCTFFVYFYIIETKGKTLEEIQRTLNGEDKNQLFTKA